MNKLYILVALFMCPFISTQAMVKICLGAAATGLGHSLYQEASKNEGLGTLGKLLHMATANMGIGSFTQKLHLQVQNYIYLMIEREDEPKISNWKSVFKIEKVIYGSTMLLGILCTLYGLKQFFQNNSFIYIKIIE